MPFTHNSVTNKAWLNEFLLSVNISRINIIETGVPNPNCLSISFNYFSLKLPYSIGSTYVRFICQGKKPASNDDFLLYEKHNISAMTLLSIYTIIH